MKEVAEQGRDDPDAPQRAARAREILDEYLAERAGGRAVSEEALLAEHADLREELAAEFAKLSLIDRARAAAENAPANGTTDDLAARETALLVRCPHCEVQVEIWEEASLAEVSCVSCGQRFDLVGLPGIDDLPRSVGRFTLIAQLGRGSFGTVWKAHDSRLEREVALKIPRRRIFRKLQIEEIMREARVAAQLRHRHIVTVHEVGHEEETVYIVSDLIRGQSLHEWARTQPITFTISAEMCRVIAEALDHAHEAGVVHRDLKPANILIDEQGEPHLTDFGLAKHAADEIALTMDGHILGTPLYMSPEQARGEAKACDPRSDVYSLGVVLFELLTGELPFRGNMSVLPHKVIHQQPPSPRRLNRYVPLDLETICLKCLEKDPRKRYQSAGELAEELGRYGRGEPILARPVGAPTRLWRWARRKPTVAALAAMTLGLLLLVPMITTWEYLRERERRQQVEALANAQTKLLQFMFNSDTVQIYLGAVEAAAESAELRAALATSERALQPLLDALHDPELGETAAVAEQDELIQHADRLALQAWAENMYARSDPEDVFAWFVLDPEGLQIARGPPLDRDTIGRSYAWRSYYTGLDADFEDWSDYVKHGDGQRLTQTHLSAAFHTERSDAWVVAVSTPVYERGAAAGRFLGVVGVFLRIDPPAAAGEGTDIE